MALISSMTDRIIPDDLIAIGELGLAGECRSVSNLEQRIKEAERLGFKHAIVPYRNIEKRKIETESINIIPIRGIYEVLNMMRENK
jgi:DNA repair protein RadA/Sms